MTDLTAEQRSYLDKLIKVNLSLPQLKIPVLRDGGELVEYLDSLELERDRYANKIFEDLNDQRRVDRKLKSLDEIPFRSILDLGGGDGFLLEEIVKREDLKKGEAFLLDPKGKSSDSYTLLDYDRNNNIPLPNESIDLVTCFQVLHHVSSAERDRLWGEINRILKPGGWVVIEDHNGNSSEFENFIDMVHQFWYYVREEEDDPLYLFDVEELIPRLYYWGFSPEKVEIKPTAMQVLVVKARKSPPFKSYDDYYSSLATTLKDFYVKKKYQDFDEAKKVLLHRLTNV